MFHFNYGCLESLVVSSAETDGIICFADASFSAYSKLLLTSPAQVLNLVTEEKAVLQAQLSQEEDVQGCFIQSALCLLQVRLFICGTKRLEWMQTIPLCLH